MTRVRILFVSLLAPLVLGLTGVVLQLAWLPSLPSPAVVHWGFGGPDRMGEIWQLPVVTLAVVVGVPTVFTVLLLALTLRRDRPFTASAKIMALVPLFAVVVTAGSGTIGIGVQRGAASAADVPGVTPWMPVLLLAAVVAVLVGWFALPRAQRRSDTAAPATPLALAPEERAVWVGRARPSTGAAVGIGAVVGLLVIAAAFVIGVTGGLGWPIVLLPILVAVLLIGFLDWRVRIDARGLAVRSVLGWPVIRVRPGAVTRVSAIDVAPLSYGGWGLRGVPGTTIGVITRSGPGILVGRRHRGDLVVTIDDAEAAASLLAALAAADAPRAV
jgi:hypothetical protein